MILGLTGKNASGKGEVAAYLKTKGFVYLSLSDELREEATKRNLKPTRDNLTNLGNELRKKFGPNYLARQINKKIKQQLENYNKKKFNNKLINENNDTIKNKSINNEKNINKLNGNRINNIGKNSNQNNEKINNNQFNQNDKIKNIGNNNELNFVVDSVRSPFEAKELENNKDFILVGIDAPIELRFKRLRERNRAGDAKTLEEFKQQEQRENLNNATNQQLDETFKLAEKVILNDGTLEELHKKIDSLINKFK